MVVSPFPGPSTTHALSRISPQAVLSWVASSLPRYGQASPLRPVYTARSSRKKRLEWQAEVLPPPGRPHLDLASGESGTSAPSHPAPPVTAAASEQARQLIFPASLLTK
jgi:hypothetical protein